MRTTIKIGSLFKSKEVPPPPVKEIPKVEVPKIEAPKIEEPKKEKLPTVRKKRVLVKPTVHIVLPTQEIPVRVAPVIEKTVKPIPPPTTNSEQISRKPNKTVYRLCVFEDKAIAHPSANCNILGKAIKVEGNRNNIAQSFLCIVLQEFIGLVFQCPDAEVILLDKKIRSMNQPIIKDQTLGWIFMVSIPIGKGPVLTVDELNKLIPIHGKKVIKFIE